MSSWPTIYSADLPGPEAPLIQEVAAAELQNDDANFHAFVQEPQPGEADDLFHLPSSWKDKSQATYTGYATELSLDVYLADFQHPTGVVDAVQSCCLASVARKRRLEVSERKLSDSEQRAMAAAKK